jgi:hypothetical protein
MANLVTVPLTVWTDEVFLRAPGVSPAGLEQALLNALREFCTDSGAWVVELWDKHTDDTPKPFNDGADAPFYDLQARLETVRAGLGGTYASGNAATAQTQFHVIDDYAPFDIALVHVMAYFQSYVWDANPSLQTQQVSSWISPTQSPGARSPRGSWAGIEGWPKVFKTQNERPGSIQLIPTLKGDQANKEGFVPWVALTFPRTYVGDSVPVVFERQWYEAILDGCLAKLLSQQDKPYTNPTLATYHSKRFRNSIAKATDMARHQFNSSEQGWSYPAWA